MWSISIFTFRDFIRNRGESIGVMKYGDLWIYRAGEVYLAMRSGGLVRIEELEEWKSRLFYELYVLFTLNYSWANLKMLTLLHQLLLTYGVAE